MTASVLAVARDAAHRFSKQPADAIELIAGEGVVGDAHCGTTVRHRSRVAVDPSQPNLRQVHLIHNELLDELRAGGFAIGPANLGENILTTGIDLLGLSTDTILHIGDAAIVRVTGLRNPCAQIDRFQRGMLAAVLDRAPDGTLIRKAGVMAIVVSGGTVRSGDAIRAIPPSGPTIPLCPV